MRRRAVLPALLPLVGLVAAVLVARLPPDFERSVVTQHHHGSDPLLTAALLRFGVNSLLHHPSRYFAPPILYPDPNPLRGTEPLVAEALLAAPLRLALGDRPAPVYTSVKLLTLALLAVATGLMLRELGVRDSLCLVGGGLAVLVTTTTAFVDRLQAVSLQWLPLGILFAHRFWRTGRTLLLVPFALAAFLLVQASLYTSVMCLGLVPFLLPLAASLRREARGAARLVRLAVGLCAAAVLSVAVLWPYLRDRADVAAYATPAYAGEKSWNPAFADELLVSPPEFGPEGWLLRPHASWNGVFPGHAFLLLLLAVAALSWRSRPSGLAEPASTQQGRAFGASKRALALFLPAAAATVAAQAWFGSHPALWAVVGPKPLARRVVPFVRLALWPHEGGAGEPLQRAASIAGLVTIVFLLLSLGSPIRLHYEGEPLLAGLFAPLSTVLPPLRELRELRRFLLPAGWAAVVGLTLALERRLRLRAAVLGPVLATAILAVGFGERVVADTRKAFAPPPPAPYEMLRASQGRGGLLELPMATWGEIESLHRMLWQPAHGRPIVAGRTGIDPSWYHPAREVLNEFPSEESALLMRAWGIDSVLERRPAAGTSVLPPELAVLRGEQTEPGTAVVWRLFDLPPLGGPRAIDPEPEPPPGRWERPAPSTSGVSASTLATDGSPDTAGDVTGADGVVLVTSPDDAVTALELDYGQGRFARVPPELRVFGLAGDEWVEMAQDASRTRLRARAAFMLLRDRSARLVVTLRPGRVRQLRLVASRGPWELPEVRVRISPAAGVTARP